MTSLPVLTALVLIGAVIIWLLVSKFFKPVGKFFMDKAKDFEEDITEEINPKEATESEPDTNEMEEYDNGL